MDDEPKFKWGAKKGVGVRNKDIQFYESFTYGGIEYSLYDCVCFFCAGNPDTYIGKLVRLYETPNHEKKVRVVWFFRPMEMRNYLCDVEPRWNELFLASGQGEGLSNVNYAEAVIGKCNVICTSKDKRNPQASEEELRKAHYIFNRTFNVGTREISEKFPDEIGGIKVEFFFNRRKDQLSWPLKLNQQSQPLNLKQQSRPFTESSRLELNKGIDSPAKNAKSASRNGSFVKELDKGTGKATVVEHECGLSGTSELKRVTVEGGNEPHIRIQVKDKSKVRSVEMISPENTSDTRPYKKRMTVTYGNGSINLEDETFGAKATKTFEKASSQLADDRSVKSNNKILDVTRRPDADRRNWFKQLPWAEKLQKAQEAETLVLLENLDASFSSVEVEDLIWHAFSEKVEARMIQYSTFSNSPNGKAFVIFKSKMAAQSAICELNSRYLILADGRPVVARRRNLRVSDKATSFAGHLVLDRKVQKQREEMRNAVSTAHCSQSNTIEYDLALEWRMLQEKSDFWWKALYENQEKEITQLKSQLKLDPNSKWLT